MTTNFQRPVSCPRLFPISNISDFKMFFILQILSDFFIPNELKQEDICLFNCKTCIFVYRVFVYTSIFSYCVFVHTCLFVYCVFVYCVFVHTCICECTIASGWPVRRGKKGNSPNSHSHSPAHKYKYKYKDFKRNENIKTC